MNINQLKLRLTKKGYVHLCANMHCSDLVYYKSHTPYSIDNMQKMSMVGIDETRWCTYPNFLIGNDQFCFHYRFGMSGNGIDIFNIYDESSGWKRFLDAPLFDGQGKNNAYFYGPVVSADGSYHLAWCWRSNGDCSSNWNVNYAYSKDLQIWSNLKGDSKSIPITPADDLFIVDNVPEKGGLLNGLIVLGFDEKNKPIIVYHKYDTSGNSNIFACYHNETAKSLWEYRKLTNWGWKWEFSGYGSIIYEIYFRKVKKKGNMIFCAYDDKDGNSIMLEYDINTSVLSSRDYHYFPQELNYKQNINLDVVHIIFDSADSSNPNAKYLIRYETLFPNHGEKPESWTMPSNLELFFITK